MPKSADLSFAAKAAANPVVDYALEKIRTDSGDHAVNLTVGKIDFDADGLSQTIKGRHCGVVSEGQALAGGLARPTDSEPCSNWQDAETAGEIITCSGQLLRRAFAKQTARPQSGANPLLTGRCFRCRRERAPAAMASIAEARMTTLGRGRLCAGPTTCQCRFGPTRDGAPLQYRLGAKTRHARKLEHTARTQVVYGVLEVRFGSGFHHAQAHAGGLVGLNIQRNIFCSGVKYADGQQLAGQGAGQSSLSPGLRNGNPRRQSSWSIDVFAPANLFEKEDWFERLADVVFPFTYRWDTAEPETRGQHNLSVFQGELISRCTICCRPHGFGRRYELGERTEPFRDYGYGQELATVPTLPRDRPVVFWASVAGGGSRP